MGLTKRIKKVIGRPSTARVAKFMATGDNANSCGIQRVTPQAVAVEQKNIAAKNNIIKGEYKNKLFMTSFLSFFLKDLESIECVFELLLFNSRRGDGFILLENVFSPELVIFFVLLSFFIT